MGTTQAAVVQYALEPLSVELREIPVPEIGEHDVLLQVGAVSVCGSTYQFHATHSWAVNVPVVLGHEFCGTVAKAGRAVRGVKEGDRVVSETAAVICGTCSMCRTGRYNLCPTRKGFGYGVNGAMASYVATPARCLHAIPEALPFETCLPVRAASPSPTSRCASTRRSIRATWSSCSARARSACCARGWRRSPAPTHWSWSGCPRCATARGGARARRHAHDRRVDRRARGPRAQPRSAGRRSRMRSLRRQPSARRGAEAGEAGRPGHQGRLVAGHDPDRHQPAGRQERHAAGSFSHNFPVWERVIHLLATGMAKPEIVVGLRKASPAGAAPSTPCTRAT